MIQRIQTIYLVLVVALNAILFFNSVAPIGIYKIQQTDGKELIIKCDATHLTQVGTSTVIDNLFPLTALAAAIAGIALISIFLYKKRKLQLRLGKLNLVLTVVLICLLFFFVEYKIKLIAGANSFSTTYLLGAYLPLFSLFFTYLANKGIKKDEELVRSADRLR